MATKKLGFEIEVTKQKDMRGKIRGYRAKFGNVEIDAKTEAEAVDGVRNAVTALTAEPLSPTVLWSLDRQEVWITVPGHDGTWGYEIHRPRTVEGVHHYSRASTVAVSTTRDEAVDRMKAHYYDVWIRPIVQGLAGLFTDWREWVCTRCKSPSQSRAPYRCKNPACEYTVEEEATASTVARSVPCTCCEHGEDCLCGSCSPCDTREEPRVKVLIELEIDGDAKDVQHVADALLDNGVPQDCFNDHECDAGPLHVRAATARVLP